MSTADAPSLPLEGVTILAVEQYGAGPFGTMLLADMGAEVLKIETPDSGGEVGRQIGPYFFGEGDSHFFQAFNRNKRSMTLNLKHPDGRAVFERLVAGADAVLDNLRGDLPEKLGLTYDDLKAVNPAIVCAHLSAYGRDGPRKGWPGYDFLMQAEAGYLSLTGEPDAPPARFGVSIVDMMAGQLAVLGLVSALTGARRTGRGMDVDVNLFDTALHNLTYLAAWYLNAGHRQGREPRSAHPSLTPCQLYRTRDGWLFIMCNKEKFWPLLAEKLGHPEWIADPRLDCFKARLDHRALVTALLDEALGERDSQAWMEILGGVVPVAPVLDVCEALDNPFVVDRGRLDDFPRAEGGDPVRMLAPPIHLGARDTPRRAAPSLGADTEAVLGAHGYSAGDIAALRAVGAI
ncbi:CaiB/BaiF CoA transferase family protein [Roseospira visakhapatnamensis]|uniref:Crotonobetainyl-CoA:carnitine CoA-transferase CaiB-like acyl-CoA transferase n=1 Tax=Roseospira visakhapatnamensis TaxID=390880 RepID=A0A7W6RBW2_9PROT|nr:CoA transferase [Roseospira visakhapatnamensis]MBB4265661.1 crotonobetainyl-CoA:carnitine CoA-transferase CaiB-like acyl-CoA transferase [Roseospira visakhapatnamensis]